ncbi:fumarate reductase subunit C [Microlunatus soli]|uniref:Fumarate reductase subunit C n=1 Tax=Microlunatus soli TaxID=630515 RepID=A0A1H1NFS9_9ACTN|nr:fumarate reductase subunit C [Microlunatus soli]SDR97794.1 fumarate reductase subunit C [Microlunatus soli]
MSTINQRRPMSTWWWTRKRTYLLFVLRELSSIFVGWFCVYLLLLLFAVARGESAYRDFLDWANSPWVVIINVVALLFVLLHTVTWFLLTPRAMVLKAGGRRVPGSAIVAAQYVVLAIVSAVVFWLVVR